MVHTNERSALLVPFSEWVKIRGQMLLALKTAATVIYYFQIHRMSLNDYAWKPQEFAEWVGAALTMHNIVCALFYLFSLLKVCYYLENVWTCPGHERSFVTGSTNSPLHLLLFPDHPLSHPLFSLQLLVLPCILFVRHNHITLGLLGLGVGLAWCLLITRSNPVHETLSLFTYSHIHQAWHRPYSSLLVFT